MRSLIFGILAFMAAISTAVTYDIPKQPFPEESPPFKLVLLSSNSSLDGMTLFACRQVILTDSLCTVNSRDMPHMGRPVPDTPRVTTFHLNYTTEPEATHQQVSPDLGVEGILTRHYANYYTDWMPASMRLGYTRAGHAVTLFRGGQERATVVGFDKEDKLFLWGRDDGSLMPQHEVTEDECYTAVYHWYVCMTKWMTEFETVVWSSGDKPDDPTCQKVDIKRVFI
ncbi:hypothetical protein DL98DRAFT_613184 [Cadophora sp. DSE1049]|nr:hypothetical protein DL98DRAFT_613184 [Cadophora sp. DSE1049]